MVPADDSHECVCVVMYVVGHALLVRDTELSSSASPDEPA